MGGPPAALAGRDEWASGGAPAGDGRRCFRGSLRRRPPQALGLVGRGDAHFPAPDRQLGEAPESLLAVVGPGGGGVDEGDAELAGERAEVAGSEPALADRGGAPTEE